MVGDGKKLVKLPTRIRILLDNSGNSLFEKRIKRLRPEHAYEVEKKLALVRQGYPIKVRALGKVSEIVITYPTKIRVYVAARDNTTLLISVGLGRTQTKDIAEARMFLHSAR